MQAMAKVMQKQKKFIYVIIKRENRKNFSGEKILKEERRKQNEKIKTIKLIHKGE